MCVGYPGLVVAVDPSGATVETDGRRRRANTLLVPDVAVGDWVLVSVGAVVDRVDPADAAFIRMSIDAANQEDPDVQPA
jgi:hydrogenase assembly chaperone HypC/HupF